MSVSQQGSMPPRGQNAAPQIVAADVHLGLLADMTPAAGDYLIIYVPRTSSTFQTAPAGWTDLGSKFADPSLLSLSICGRLCDGSTYADPYARPEDPHGFIQVRDGTFDFGAPSSYASVTAHQTADNVIEWAASRLDARLTVQIATARESQTDRGVLQAVGATLYPPEFNGTYLDTRVGWFAGPMPASQKGPAPDSASITAVLSFT